MAKDNSFYESGQDLALRWLTEYLRHPAKAENIRDVKALAQGSSEHNRALRLHAGTLRHLRLLRYFTAPHIRKKIKPGLEAILLLGLFEALDNAESDPRKNGRIVHSWVELGKRKRSATESRFLNAVLRKCVDSVSRLQNGHFCPPDAIRHSHPDWLVDKWTRLWGPETTLRLLEWNQQPPDIYIRREPDLQTTQPDLTATRWTHFFRLDGDFSEALRESLASGNLTVQDPATRIAVHAASQEKPESVLDLCASPGGKTRFLASLLPEQSRLHAVDLPDRRERLLRNLAHWADRIHVHDLDLNDPASGDDDWKNAYAVVLLDAPCSNTGVLRRKPDVKWRLRPEDLQTLPRTQLKFLTKAAEWVRPGGALVYSTCSLEPEENRCVVDDFLRSPVGSPFHLETAVAAHPLKTGHDGAGVFRLRRSWKLNE